MLNIFEFITRSVQQHITYYTVDKGIVVFLTVCKLFTVDIDCLITPILSLTVFSMTLGMVCSTHGWNCNSYKLVNIRNYDRNFNFGLKIKK